MNHHPDSSLLYRYAQGTIDELHALTVSAHLEHCSCCQQQVHQFEQQLAVQELSQNQVTADESLNALMSGILARKPAANRQTITHTADFLHCDLSEKNAVGQRHNSSTITVNNRQFSLPRALRRVAPRLGRWRSYAGKLMTNQIRAGEDGRLSLLYIPKGVSLPQHTHNGLESTLVLHGRFKDEHGEYHQGDFIQLDGKIHHSPQTFTTEDCLCLSVLTQPVRFTKGVSKTLNMFNGGFYP